MMSRLALLRKGFYIVEEFFVGLPFFLKIYFGYFLLSMFCRFYEDNRGLPDERKRENSPRENVKMT